MMMWSGNNILTMKKNCSNGQNNEIKILSHFQPISSSTSDLITAFVKYYIYANGIFLYRCYFNVQLIRQNL